MKSFLSILCFMSLLTISVSCNREMDQGREIQREEAIEGDDLRETDSYQDAVPVQEEDIQKDQRP